MMRTGLFGRSFSYIAREGNYGPIGDCKELLAVLGRSERMSFEDFVQDILGMRSMYTKYVFCTGSLTYTM